MGTIHLLEALRRLGGTLLGGVLITTDEVNHRSPRRDDPYSNSKAAAELAIASWRASFCGCQPHQTPHLHVARARAGNVIGGGDWAVDRIVPDAMWALGRGEPIGVRNPAADPPLAARDSLYLVLARWEVTALLSADQRLLKLAAKVLP